MQKFGGDGGFGGFKVVTWERGQRASQQKSQNRRGPSRVAAMQKLS
jgi:hypothetical protein